MKKTKEINALAKQLQQPESKVILDEMTGIAESPEYQKSAPPETQSQLTSAIQAAKELYQTEAKKNDWLEVAQTLAGAVAQFGAAQQAGDRYVSRPQIAPNTDWAGRTNRARGDYLESARQAEAAANTTRQSWQDTEAGKKEQYGRTWDPLRERLRNAQQIEGDEARFSREELRDAARDKKAKEQSDLAERKFEDQKLLDEEKRLIEKEKAGLVLANSLTNDSDLSKKNREKIAASYSAQAGAAGIDPNVLVDIAEQSKDSGIFGTGILRGEDKKKKSQLIQEQVLAPIRTQLDAIRQKRDALRTGKSPVQQTQTPVESQEKAAKRDPQIEQYATQNKLDYEAAKKVLVGRGYKPAE
jgi:hypothetical protein